MTVTPQSNRRSVRLKGYDYATPGGYFVTVCTAGRQPFFADPEIARMVNAAWEDLPHHHQHVETDQFVVMANHVHGILFLGASDTTGARAQRVAPLQRSGLRTSRDSLGAIIRAFKARVTRDVRAMTGADVVVWQRNYHEHVIRNEAALQRIRQYSVDNPARWKFDHENPIGQPDRAELEFAGWLKDTKFHFVNAAGVRR